MYDFFPSEEAFESEQLDFNLKIWTNQRSVVKIHLCLSNDSKAKFLGSSFLKKHRQTAFESEQSDFHLRIGQNQRAVVKIQFIYLVFLKRHGLLPQDF